ncbi:uncharacterized protein LOC126893098 [Diabrotica virgifera virgifera]|uniref:RNase H type-1 domain-containing protein n=1 Tax=Diabrotica virgifera virgifera TaxID=50390 RepID=A0ABM5L986_DIAVI|nr:uncharacterized protein LOC126893098 [Diabrotica virgifera virgifera]
MVKYRSCNTYLSNTLNLVNIENLTNRYWSKKRSPPLADACIDTYPYEKWIHNHSKYPLYECKYDTLIVKPRVIFPEYSNLSSLNNVTLKSILGAQDNEVAVYRDGSKTRNSSGFAFYVPSTGHTQLHRVADFTSIFTAEALAIKRALQWCLENQVQKIAILTDSQSVLLALLSHPTKHYKNIIIYDIRKIIQYLGKLDRKVRFIWVKGHAGIIGNEHVDIAAKDACHLENIIYETDANDLLAIFRNKIRSDWESLYTSISEKSQSHYYRIHRDLPKNIPHLTFPVSRRYSSIITRLKLHHGRFPAHLHKINIIDSPLCSCSNMSIGDLNHIFFDCTKYTLETLELMTELNNIKFPLPVNISALLASFDKRVYDILVHFVIRTKVDI